MALNLSKEDREWLEATLAAADPYPDDASEINTLDMPLAEEHSARWAATMAKRLLEQDDREKVAEPE